jgi:hypothetical protein
MKYEDLKEELGDLIHECTFENFDNGYDPISDLIDDFENINDIPHDLLLEIEENAPWDLTEDFLYSMARIKSTDSNYKKIYLIDFYCNGFYYSKEEDDLFSEEWKHWDHKLLQGGKTRSWYYYFIHRHIMHKYEIDSSILDNVESKFLFETDYKKEWKKLFLNDNCN